MTFDRDDEDVAQCASRCSSMAYVVSYSVKIAALEGRAHVELLAFHRQLGQYTW